MSRSKFVALSSTTTWPARAALALTRAMLLGKELLTLAYDYLTLRRRVGRYEMPPEFDQEGLDAFLDLKSQCAVVTHTWEQLSHHRKHGQEEEADAQFQEQSENPEEVHASAIELLKDYWALCDELGVPEKDLQTMLFLRLPQAVLEDLALSSH